MERRVTPPRRVTSPTWGPPPPYKQALSPNQLFAFVFAGTNTRRKLTEKNDRKWSFINIFFFTDLFLNSGIMKELRQNDEP